jgi:hypothetical protein
MNREECTDMVLLMVLLIIIIIIIIIGTRGSVVG